MDGRAAHSTKNTFFAAIAYVTKMLLNFVVRAIFVRYLAVEYLGLNGLYSNILNVLSLAELGVGNAIVYSMYKPIADNDTEKIKSFLRLYRNFYLIIGGVVVVIGLSLIPALPYLIKDAPNVDVNLTVVYVLYLSHNVIGYFFAYRRSLVFAYQRNDIESKVGLIVNVALSIVQVIIMVVWRNYYAYIAVMVVFSAADAAIVFALSYKLFPDIRGKAQPINKADKREIAKNTSALVFHKIGSAAVFSTDSIIISAYIGATILGMYSNYTLVTTAFLSIINLFITAVRSSVGNLIATKTKEDVYKIYKALNMVLMWLVCFFTLGLVICFQDFIVLLTGNAAYKLEYLTVILICTSFYLTASRRMTDAFKECAGLFWNDKFKPLFEAGINLGLDILLVRYIGINGVIVATIVSTVAAPLWVEPFVLYKNYFKVNTVNYFIRYAIYTIVAFCAGAAAFGCCYFIPSSGIWCFIAKFVICLILPNLIFVLAYHRTQEFKYLLTTLKRIFGRKSKKATLAAVGAEEQIANACAATSDEIESNEVETAVTEKQDEKTDTDN
ncbi:MAG: oligosaccharide flippase family protein [Clostridiales bacterium]|nr:oligosaccharide flippase family protein [Clostridiales bacterium]